MASPVADSYACASGGSIHAGRKGRPLFCLIGHSMAGQSEYDPTTLYGALTTVAAHKFGNAFLGMPFDYPYCHIDKTIINPPSGSFGRDVVNGFYGASGQTSATINTQLAQNFYDLLQPYTTGREVVCGMWAEVNDIGNSIAASTTWSNYLSMMDKLRGWKILPNLAVPSSTFASAGPSTQWSAFNALASTSSDQRILKVLDFSSPYLDTGSSYPTPLSGYTSDGTHLAQKGAFVLGVKMAQQMTGLYPRWTPLAGDVVCSANPTLSGSGGTLGANASGVVPTGYTLNAAGTGFSVVGSRASDYYQLQFSYSGGSVPYSTGQGLVAAANMANATPGTTVVQSLCDVEIVQCTNYQFGSQIEYGSGNGAIPYLDALYGYDALQGSRICWHDDPHVIPATATKAVTSFYVRPVYQAASASLTVRLRWMGTKVA